MLVSHQEGWKLRLEKAESSIGLRFGIGNATFPSRHNCYTIRHAVRRTEELDYVLRNQIDAVANITQMKVREGKAKKETRLFPQEQAKMLWDCRSVLSLFLLLLLLLLLLLWLLLLSWGRSWVMASMMGGNNDEGCGRGCGRGRGRTIGASIAYDSS